MGLALYQYGPFTSLNCSVGCVPVWIETDEKPGPRLPIVGDMVKSPTATGLEERSSYAGQVPLPHTHLAQHPPPCQNSSQTSLLSVRSPSALFAQSGQAAWLKSKEPQPAGQARSYVKRVAARHRKTGGFNKESLEPRFLSS